MNRPLETLEVYATFANDEPPDQFVGTIEIPEIRTWQDMPIELEINGVIYKPQF